MHSKMNSLLYCSTHFTVAQRLRLGFRIPSDPGILRWSFKNLAVKNNYYCILKRWGQCAPIQLSRPAIHIFEIVLRFYTIPHTPFYYCCSSQSILTYWAFKVLLIFDLCEVSADDINNFNKPLKIEIEIEKSSNY